MDYRQISIQLLEKLGGKENISSNAACMTRLRVGIRDMSRVDLAGVKKVEGVLGVVESNTLQIVFGPDWPRAWRRILTRRLQKWKTCRI